MSGGAVYSAYAVAVQRKQIDVESDDIRVLLLTDGYTFADADLTLDAVDAGDRIGTAVALTSVAVVADGSVGADDATIPSVLDVDPVAGVLVYQHTGTESTSTLMAFYDRQSDSTTIDLATTGADVAVRWPAGRVLKL